MGRVLPDYKKLVLDALPGSAPEIAKKARIAVKTVRRWLAVLMRPGVERQVRIESWVRRAKGPAVPVYGKGDGANAPRPSPYSNAERCARYLDANGRRTGCVDRLHERVTQTALPAQKVDYRNDRLLFWIPSRVGV